MQFIKDNDVSVTAIDLSSEMLDRAKNKYDSTNFKFIEMDAQELTFSLESFDMVIANLILSVVPDPNRCFQEMIRVTRAGGHIIFSINLPLQSFVPSQQWDIGRHFEQIIMPYEKQIRVEEDASALFNGMYRKIVIRKTKV